ncbi:hypothetical protein JOM56_011190 [Amanita muscaria]
MSEDVEMLRTQFSHLTLLLALVTAINNRSNHPTLHGAEVFEERLQRIQSNSRTKVMEAAIGILVQNTEILAGMSYGGSAVTVAVEEKIKGPESDVGLSVDPLDAEPTPDYDPLEGALHMATTGNHDTKRDKHLPAGKISLLPSGCNLWDEIKDLPLKPARACFTLLLAKKPHRVSLVDHVATVQGYLNWYKNADNDDRAQQSARFSEYLVAACWRKMHRRIHNWAAVGLVHDLSKISDEMLSRVLNMITYSSQPDVKLAHQLLSQDEGLSIIMKRYPIDSPSDTGPNPPHGGLQRLWQSALNGTILYTRDTALEFHHFVVATLITYARALKCLHDAEKSKVTCHAARVLVTSRLLTAIVYSKAFECHINGLVENRFLSLPNFPNFPEYHKFAKVNSMSITPKAVGQEGTTRGAGGGEVADTEEDKDDDDDEDKNNKNDGEDKDNGGEDKDNDDEDKDNDDEDKDNDDEDKDNDDEDKDNNDEDKDNNDEDKDNESEEDGVDDFGGEHVDDFEEELAPGPLSDPSHIMISSLIRDRMRLLVNHLTAKRILENYCVQKHVDVEIKLLGINPETAFRPSWETLTSVIGSVTSGTNLSPSTQSIVDHLKDRIEHTLISAKLPASNKIFMVFDQIIKGEEGKRPYYTVHCEAALAAFASTGRGAAEGVAGLLAQLNLDRREVVVSKLCCPACWELMKVLRDSDSENSPYHVRGRHSTVYPVILPPWLDDADVRALVTRFTTYLQEELNTMLTQSQLPSQRTHSRHPSSESDAAWSDVSGSSRPSIDSDKQVWSELEQDEQAIAGRSNNT